MNFKKIVCLIKGHDWYIAGYHGLKNPDELIVKKYTYCYRCGENIMDDNNLTGQAIEGFRTSMSGYLTLMMVFVIFYFAIIIIAWLTGIKPDGSMPIIIPIVIP